MAITTSESNKSHAIIHVASTASAAIGAGLAQIPGSDIVPITAIQIGMVISLAAVFAIPMEKSQAKAIVASAVAGQVGKQVARQLVGWIPGWGNAMKAVTAAAFTEAIGWKVAQDFSNQ